MSDEVKVGDNLEELVTKLNEAQNNVSEALKTYASVFEGLAGGENSEGSYKGNAQEALTTYASFICNHLSSLAETYGKISTYVSYVHESMNEFDKELAEQIGSAFASLSSGGED